MTHSASETVWEGFFTDGVVSNHMARAFIMVKVAAGYAEPLLDTVRGIDRVVEAHVVAGEYDLIVEAEAPEVYDVIHSAATEIRGLENVIDTKTYVCLE